MNRQPRGYFGVAVYRPRVANNVAVAGSVILAHRHMTTTAAEQAVAS